MNYILQAMRVLGEKVIHIDQLSKMSRKDLLKILRDYKSEKRAQ